MSTKALEDLLYRESGLKGMSGISNDMRELEASDDPAALLAIELFCLSDRIECGHAGCGARRARCIRFHCWYRRKLTDDP